MDHPLGALAAYKRIITIAGCANIVSGFVTLPVLSFLSSSPSIIYDSTNFEQYCIFSQRKQLVIKQKRYKAIRKEFAFLSLIDSDQGIFAKIFPMRNDIYSPWGMRKAWVLGQRKLLTQAQWHISWIIKLYTVLNNAKNLIMLTLCLALRPAPVLFYFVFNAKLFYPNFRQFYSSRESSGWGRVKVI